MKYILITLAAVLAGCVPCGQCEECEAPRVERYPEDTKWGIPTKPPGETIFIPIEQQSPDIPVEEDFE